MDDEMVERVAKAISRNLPVVALDRVKARAAIAALSTPEFVLPLAEKMLVSVGTGYGLRLLDAYRAAKGE